MINITTGGGQGMTLEQRLAAAMRAKPEMCSLNMGSMNFGRFGIANRIKEFRFDWEADDLEASRDYIFRNTYKDIEYILRELGETHGVRFEFECYDVGHLYNLAHFLERGLVKPPLFVQTIFGILGGIGTDAEDLLHMKRTADRLLRRRLSVVDPRRGPAPDQPGHDGRDHGRQCPGRARGQHLPRQGRAGEEQRASWSPRSARILEELSLEIATPDEAREMLQLKGVHNVGF